LRLPFKISSGAVLLILVSAYFIFLIRADWVVLGQLNAEKAALSGLIGEASAESGALREEIRLLDRLDYVELVARQKLGLVKRGETAYKVVD